MRRNVVLLAVFLLYFSLPIFASDLSAIHANALPQETAVLAALDDARELEPYSKSWTMKWEYPIPKEDVVARLGKDLGFLTLAMKGHPDNAELALLTGLVARYAYNLDVDGSHDAAMSALGAAEKLAPGDFRAGWFRATLECQTRELKAGAEEFLAIESSHAWDALPAAFWQDYSNCTTIADLPAHTLRAVDHMEKLHAGDPSDFATLLDLAHNQIIAYDLKKKYEPKEVWAGQDVGADTVFTGTLCGVRLQVHGDWSIGRLDYANGSCVALFMTGPYQATTRGMRPSVMLLVQQPKENETLEVYAKKFQGHGTFEPFVPARCPAQSCIAFKGVQPGAYKSEGDGRPRMVFFEREQPEFPGLIFESPEALPESDANSGTQIYRPTPRQQRIPGKLFYLVALDTAASIEEPALKDFDFFLQNLTVE